MEISNFFNTYGSVHHVKCPQDPNIAFVYMTKLSTPAEHRRTRSTIEKIIQEMPLDNQFTISVARSRRQFLPPYIRPVGYGQGNYNRGYRQGYRQYPPNLNPNRQYPHIPNRRFYQGQNFGGQESGISSESTNNHQDQMNAGTNVEQQPRYRDPRPMSNNRQFGHYMGRYDRRIVRDTGHPQDANVYSRGPGRNYPRGLENQPQPLSELQRQPNQYPKKSFPNRHPRQNFQRANTERPNSTQTHA